MMKLTFIILFYFVSFSLKASELNCNEEVKLDIEQVTKLINSVKNNVLGSVPLFCRDNSYEQLTEQIDGGEKGLNDFIKKLKAAKISEEESIEEKIKSNGSINDLTLQVIQLTAAKKIWRSTTKDEKIQIMTNTKCSWLGFNRFTLENAKTATSASQGDTNQVEALCEAQELKHLIPFLSKDVLAEALFNLKKLLPTKFPQLINLFCEELKKIDESYLSEDGYKNFVMFDRSISSVGEYNQWLKDLYGEVRGSKEDKNKFQEISSKQYQNNVAAVDEQTTLKKTNIEEKGKNKKEEIYESALKKNPDLKTVNLFNENKGYSLVKTKSGKIFCVADEEKKKNAYKINTTAYAEEFENKIKKYFSSYQDNLKKVYEGEEGIKSTEEHPGFVIVYKEGKYSYEATPELKKYIEETLDQKDKMINEFNKKYSQEELEDLYYQSEQYMTLYLMGMEGYDTSFCLEGDSLQGSYGQMFAVKKNDQGKFEYGDPVEISKEQQKEVGALYEEIYLKMQSSSDSEGPVPFPLYPDYVLMKNKKGNFLIQPISGNQIGLNKLFETTSEEEYEEPIRELTKNSLRSLYQKRSMNPEKIADLSIDELKGIALYTGAGYVSLNKCLRQSSCSEAEKNIIKNIISGIKKIQRPGNSTYTTFRGVSYLPENILSQLNSEKSKEEPFVLDKGFMSTSAEYSTAHAFSGNNIKFVIDSKSCVGISFLSTVQGEDEFLCPPGLKFIVKKKMSNENIYYLEEVSEANP